MEIHHLVTTSSAVDLCGEKAKYSECFRIMKCKREEALGERYEMEYEMREN